MDPQQVDAEYQVRNLPNLGNWDQYTMSTFVGDIGNLALSPAQAGPTVYRISSTPAVNIAGIVAPTRFWPVILLNVGSFPIYLLNQSVLATAINRFQLPLPDLAFEILPFTPVMLFYDVFLLRWMMLGPITLLNHKGDLLTWDAVFGGPVSFPQGAAADGTVLTKQSALSTGLAWQTVPPGAMSVTGAAPPAGPYTGATITVDQSTGLVVVAGPAISLLPADLTHWGVMTTLAQDLAGVKAFWGNATIIHGGLLLDGTTAVSPFLFELTLDGELPAFLEVDLGVPVRTSPNTILWNVGSPSYSGLIITQDVSAIQYHYGGPTLVLPGPVAAPVDGDTGVDSIGNVFVGGINTRVGGPPGGGGGGFFGSAMGTGGIVFGGGAVSDPGGGGGGGGPCVSLAFDGSFSQYGQIANYDFTSAPFSFACWVRTTYPGTYNILVGRSAVGGWGIYLNASFGYIAFEGLYTTVTSSPGLNVSDGKWHNVLVCYTGSTVKFYLDAVAVGTSALSDVFNSSFSPYYVCAGFSHATFADVEIEDIRIYDQDESANAVVIFHGICPSADATTLPGGHLVGWWLCNDGSGSVAHATYGADAVLVNSPSWVVSCPCGEGSGLGAGSGSIVFGGSAVGGRDFPAIGSGSIVFGGTAVGGRDFPAAGSGSIVFGGTAVGAFNSTGTCLGFVGASSQYGTLANFDAIGSNLTCSVWIKYGSHGGSFDPIVFTGSFGGWGCYIHPDGALFFGKAGVSEIGSGGTSVADGNWHHLMWVYNGVLLKTYLDGANISTNAYVVSFSGGGVYNMAAFPFQGVYLTARLTDLRLYNSDQSANIAAIYNGGVPNFSDSTIGSIVQWWQLYHGYGSVALNTIGGGVDATLINSPTWIVDYP